VQKAQSFFYYFIFTKPPSQYYSANLRRIYFLSVSDNIAVEIIDKCDKINF